MTTVLKKSTTPNAVDRFRKSFNEYTEMENQKNSPQVYQEVVPEPVQQQELPVISAVKRPQHKNTTSDPPTLFAYKLQDTLQNTKSEKFHNKTEMSETQKAKILKEYIELKESTYSKPSCYNQKFAPNKEYIYTPNSNKTVSNSVQYQKAQLGQTAYLPIAGNSSETFWRTNWNQTQFQNDDEGRKAFVGYENLGNTFVINKQFTIDTTSGKVLDSEVNAPPGIQGKVFNINTDMQSVTRKEFAALNNMAYEIAHNDKTASHNKWLSDKQKPSPVPVGVKVPYQSTNQTIQKQYYRNILVEEKNETDLTMQSALQAAKKMYGDSPEVENWVQGLSATRVKQIAEIGEQAMKSGTMQGQDMLKKIPDWFYMKM